MVSYSLRRLNKLSQANLFFVRCISSRILSVKMEDLLLKKKKKTVLGIYKIISKCICEKLAEDPMREREWYEV